MKATVFYTAAQLSPTRALQVHQMKARHLIVLTCDLQKYVYCAIELKIYILLALQTICSCMMESKPFSPILNWLGHQKARQFTLNIFINLLPYQPERAVYQIDVMSVVLMYMDDIILFSATADWPQTVFGQFYARPFFS